MLTNQKINDIINYKIKQREVMFMRKLIYCLADGHKVDSLTKAKESGQTYTVTCEAILEPVHITEKQKARRIKI